MRSTTLRKHQRALVLGVASFVGGCGDDLDDERPFEATVADCGSGLAELLAGAGAGDEPSLDASFSEALASWSFGDFGCGLAVLSGACADGKRLLYRNGGFTSETRYYDGEVLVGMVVSGDVGYCPSVCPFSRYYGALDDVRCDAPTFEDLCEGPSALLESGLEIPFANGSAPGGCEP